MRILLLIVATALGASTAHADEPPAPTRPNVLILLADDLGWMDVGFNNSDTFYETPHLDRLAREGMRFTQAYAACPVCSPTRASLMTGAYPARLHTTDYFGAPQPHGILAAAERGQNGRFQRLPLLPAEYVNRLPDETITLAEALRTGGYATFFAGKWHLGREDSTPLHHGFDVNVAGHHRGGPYGPGKYFHPFGMPNLESEPGDHLPARLSEETIEFITANREDPWFAMLSFYSVHTPLMGREDLVAHYRAKRERLGLEAAWGREGQRKVRLVQEHAVYGAMVHAMDEAIGDVLGALDDLGLADNTLIIFFSDNGGLSTSEGHPTSNLPLRAGKGWLYEGGIREPCVVRWPGHVAPESVCTTPIISCDVAPTVLDALQVTPPDGALFDGQSIVPLLREPERGGQRTLYWHYPHWGNQGGTPGGAIRDGDWKLIEFYTDRAPELYDLAADPGETNDLAAANPERVRVMRATLSLWRELIGARMPTPNPLLEKASEEDAKP